MIRVATLFSQLIFRHALRVRLNTASPEKKEPGDGVSEENGIPTASSANGLGGAATPLSGTATPAVIPGADGESQFLTIPVAGVSSSASGSSTPAPSFTVDGSKTDKGKTKDKDKDKGEEKEKKKDSHAGAITNLITVDLDNVNWGLDLGGRKCHIIYCPWVSADDLLSPPSEHADSSRRDLLSAVSNPGMEVNPMCLVLENTEGC